ncbi:MAG: thioredoxin-disulfide reductase [Candidatus Cloacimonetes bacterium]|nr:thioredoxin-disulfide reductase [Candidatus Cloacimonadota bacterium]
MEDIVETIQDYDIAVIGGGPAGLAAGVYASRGGLKTVLFEKALIGGQITTTADVENYPGFEETLSGFDITDKMKKQAEKFGTEIIQENIRSLKFEKLNNTVETASAKYKVKAIILATGANPSKLGIEGEEKYTGRGVSYCATCDGALYRGKTVAVVGGGDSAVEEAIFLTKFAKKVYIIHRRDKLRAVKLTQERALGNEKIEVVWDSVVKAIKGTEYVEKLEIYNKKTQKTSELSVDGIFIYVGIIPNNELVNSQIKLDEQGFIITNASMHTNIPGIYAAGDVVQKILRQVVTAAADGAIAAFSAEKWLEENKDKQS